MPRSDPRFSHLLPASRDDVFERLEKAFNRFPKINECFGAVLCELGAVARNAILDTRLQIEVVVGTAEVPLTTPGAPTWAFPVHRQGWIKEFVEVCGDTRVLLLLFQPDIELLLKEEVLEDLRHELGHAFLYLRDPDAKEDCDAADEEWKRCTQPRNLTVLISLGGLAMGQ